MTQEIYNFSLIGKLISHFVVSQIWWVPWFFLCIFISSSDCFGEPIFWFVLLPAIAAPIPSLWREGFSKGARLLGLLWGELMALIGVPATIVLLFLVVLGFVQSATGHQLVLLFFIMLYVFTSAALAIIVAGLVMNRRRGAEARGAEASRKSTVLHVMSVVPAVFVLVRLILFLLDLHLHPPEAP